MKVDILETSNKIKQKAFELGFDLIGFSKADDLISEQKNLEFWLDSGYDADMSWIERTKEKRLSPKKILNSAKSIISLGLNYYQKGDFTNSKNIGKISKYAWGIDYHLVIEEKNKSLINFLNQLVVDSTSIAFVDYGPTMDKVLARNGGLGWVGKNSNLINKNIGSWFFISTIITDIELLYDEQIKDYCGTCNKCINACPTKAIVEPYIIDSNKCISYLTIENKNEIPSEFKGNFENWIFGCDICQDVCPWNIKYQTETKEKQFTSNTIKELNSQQIEDLTTEKFNIKFSKSSMKRCKLNGLKRNIDFLKTI